MKVLSDAVVGGPVGFRQWLQRLGPTYVKLGQFLALRPDLVPQEYADELLLLFDRVAPFSWRQARSVLTEDLGTDPANLFALLNPRPIAAGSLAQTHAARLPDGSDVVIKIQRPGIRSRLERDL